MYKVDVAGQGTSDSTPQTPRWKLDLTILPGSKAQSIVATLDGQAAWKLAPSQGVSPPSMFCDVGRGSPLRVIPVARPGPLLLPAVPAQARGEDPERPIAEMSPPSLPTGPARSKRKGG